MKQLEQLEKKVAQVIQKYKNLQLECNELKSQNKKLQEHTDQLQVSLIKENTNLASLAQEKDSIKATIEELLASINSLESAER